VNAKRIGFQPFVNAVSENRQADRIFILSFVGIRWASYARLSIRPGVSGPEVA